MVAQCTDDDHERGSGSGRFRAGLAAGWCAVAGIWLPRRWQRSGSRAANPPGYQRRRSCVLRVLIVRKLSTVTRELTGPHATDPGATRACCVSSTSNSAGKMTIDKAEKSDLLAPRRDKPFPRRARRSHESCSDHRGLRHIYRRIDSFEPNYLHIYRRCSLFVCD